VALPIGAASLGAPNDSLTISKPP